MQGMPEHELTPVENLKMAAAASAVAQIKDGMVVGLGTGSTSAFIVRLLEAKVREGMRIIGVPTSKRTADAAQAAGIALSTLAEHPELDLAIDGADEVQRGNLQLIKGLGGALLWEKIVASAAKRFLVIVDETKLVDRLGGRTPVPVEVVSYGWQSAERRLRALGAKPVLRKGADGNAFVTDGGHYILDCTFGPIASPEALNNDLDHVVGVVEHGLFINMTSEVHLAAPGGVQVLKPGA